MPSDLRDRLSSAVLIGSGGARYQVRELLGEGGQGWVFKATTDDAGEPAVVVKILRPDIAKADVLPRFDREVSVLRALSSGPAPHPNIVRFLDHGRAKVAAETGPVDISYLVLELIEGPPLRRVLHAHGGFGLPVARVRRILRGVARALGDMHAQGIVHRDLKPSNILLAQQDGAEVAKVTDFGLVKVLDASVHQTVTMAGASAGYAPPEQYEVGNRRVGPATDVFAFAAILYEVLSGCEAFPVTPGETALQIVARMLGGDRPALARVSATIPRELRDRGELTIALDREIARATDGDPSRRHASIDELWNTVAPLLRAASSPSSAGKPSDPPPLTPNVAERLGREVPPRSAVQPTSRGDKRPSLPDGPSARVVGKPMTGERLRSGAFASDGSSLVAIGAYGMYRFASGVWSALRAPRGVDARALRGVVRVPSGELLLYGDGCAVLAAKDGASTRVDPGDADVTWLGALADDRGVCLVGERRSRPVGVVAILTDGAPPKARDLEGTSRIHAAARLGAGQVLVCGTHGALLVIDGDDVRSVAWGRTGHLYAAASSPEGGAFAVGSGGHALAIASPPKTPHVAPPATLEAVQTTRDLLGVAVDPQGVAWAVGGQGRLLARRAGTWTRVPVEIGAANLIAIACRETPRALTGVDGARPREVITLAEDGAVVEVRLGD
ncbi:MAG: protein kinase [Polyangiaceae bacterium]